MVRSYRGIVLCTVFAASACDVDSADSGLPESLVVSAVDDIEASPTVQIKDADAIIDEITLDEGAVVRFVDEGVSVPGGGVGMLALGIPGFGAEIRRLDLTPLEVYGALAPHKDPPKILRDHHLAAVALQDRPHPEPRKYHLEDGALVPVRQFSAVPPKPLFTQTTGGAYCADWASEYCDDIEDNQGGHDWCATAWVTDDAVYAYTGSATQRWLGAANCTEFFDWEVQAEVSASLWQLVTGTQIQLGWFHNFVEYTSSGSLMNFRSLVDNQVLGAPWDYRMGAARD